MNRLILGALVLFSVPLCAQGPAHPPPFAYPEQFSSSRHPQDDYRWAQRGAPIDSRGGGAPSTQPTIPLSPPAEVISNGPSWYSVEYWYNPKQWAGSFELGVNGTEGNAQTMSMRTGLDLKRTVGSYTMKFDLDYAKTHANSIETQHNALLKVDQKWTFGESPWSAFFTTGLEYDEFRAFDLRLVLNGGLGYAFFKTETSQLGGRFGSGVNREFGGPDTRWVPEAMFGLDYSRRITKRQKFTFTTDYFPEWGAFDDFRLQSKANWELLIDDEANLSLKLGIVDRYDSTPQNRKHNDLDYTAVILWKL